MPSLTDKSKFSLLNGQNVDLGPYQESFGI